MKNKNLTGKIILSIVSGLLFSSLYFYIELPAINPANPSFWFSLALVILSFAYPFLLKKSQGQYRMSNRNGTSTISFDINGMKLNKIVAAVVVIPVVIMILGSVISSTVFNARAYAGVITVTEADFATDMKETNEVTNIALMDGNSARYLGNKTLGSVSHMVSQYVVSDNYTQINYQYTPKKVANLEHADFFKWFANKEKGVPGYVMVDPVNNSAEYIELKTPLKYVDSAYFNDDLMRKLRFAYPTKIFDDFISFEVDDEGNPFYIITCLKPKVFPFGAMDVCEAVIFDPCTGESKLYAVEEIPAWVDAVYSGDLAEQKYNWYGTLSGGFINSIIGNKDCKQTTDDYGYIVIGDDVWYFTGVTSVTSDESNIGFIISNARTGEYKYYPVVGAEEYGAMHAAEGVVQEKGYKASFPSLINVSGQATYIMVLKDASGYVRLYALVNVEHPSIVATASKQEEAMKAYKELLVENGIIDSGKLPDDSLPTANITIADIKTYTVDGNTVFYFVGTDGFYYKGMLKDFENMIFFTVGETAEVRYSETENAKIREIENIAGIVLPVE
ncbi:MAG: hypothetical protein E7603_04890 [Ruminococcaceae bacterium]|nr:hypothetical protein [Oscillospiraceae bacterium]